MRFIRVDGRGEYGAVHIRYTGVDEHGTVQLDVLPTWTFGQLAWNVKLTFHARNHAEGLAAPAWHTDQDIAAVIARAYEQLAALMRGDAPLQRLATSGDAGDPPCVKAAFVDNVRVKEVAA